MIPNYLQNQLSDSINIAKFSLMHINTENMKMQKQFWLDAHEYLNKTSQLYGTFFKYYLIKKTGGVLLMNVHNIVC